MKRLVLSNWTSFFSCSKRSEQNFIIEKINSINKNAIFIARFNLFSCQQVEIIKTLKHWESYNKFTDINYAFNVVCTLHWYNVDSADENIHGNTNHTIKMRPQHTEKLRSPRAFRYIDSEPHVVSKATNLFCLQTCWNVYKHRRYPCSTSMNHGIDFMNAIAIARTFFTHTRNPTINMAEEKSVSRIFLLV